MEVYFSPLFIFVFSKIPGKALFMRLISLVSFAKNVASCHVTDSGNNRQIVTHTVLVSQMPSSEWNDPNYKVPEPSDTSQKMYFYQKLESDSCPLKISLY